MKNIPWHTTMTTKIRIKKINHKKKIWLSNKRQNCEMIQISICRKPIFSIFVYDLDFEFVPRLVIEMSIFFKNTGTNKFWGSYPESL